MIVAMSSFVSSYLPLILAAIVAAGVAFWYWLRRPGERIRIDYFVLGLPLAGPTVRSTRRRRPRGRWRRSWRHPAGELARHQRAPDRQPVHGARAGTAQQVREGTALAQAMNERGQFPDVAIKMIEVGESTGALQDMLNSLRLLRRGD